MFYLLTYFFYLLYKFCTYLLTYKDMNDLHINRVTLWIAVNGGRWLEVSGVTVILIMMPSADYEFYASK